MSVNQQQQEWKCRGVPRRSTDAALLAAFLAAVFLVACGDNPVDPYECTEESEEDCKVDDGFSFRTYEPSCESESTADYCGLPEASDNCVEPDYDIEESTIAELHSALENGDVSCEWVTRRHYEHILWQDLRMTESMPPMNAFVHINQNALETARLLDDYQRCEGELAGPLHCVPFAIKDNYASDEVPLTAGSLALHDPQPENDAFTVNAMRRAGAVMIGSTTMDELARGVHGLSGRSGKTGNAYDTRFNSGGSSSGSAVATTANMAMGALGTDNCSSLMMPSAYAGLFTLRSSVGLVSTQGIYPSNRVDMVAGPMTRTATDLAAFFDVLSQHNPSDRRHTEREMIREESYSDFLDKGGLEGKRIGVLQSLGQGDDERRPFDGSSAADTEHFDAFIAELNELGAVIVGDISLPDFDDSRRGTGQGVDVDRFLKDTTGGVSSMEEFCKTGLYSQWLFDTVEDCLKRADQSESELLRRVERGEEQYAENRDYVESALDELDLDALLFPVDTRGGASLRARSNNCILPSVTGLPTMVVPSGFNEDEMPVGMAFLGRLYDEATLFEIAYGYEQATMHRLPPQLLDYEGFPPIDAEEFNHIHFEFGVAAFDEVLGHSDKYDLSAPIFTELARQVLEDNDLEVLIEPDPG